MSSINFIASKQKVAESKLMYRLNKPWLVGLQKFLVYIFLATTALLAIVWFAGLLNVGLVLASTSLFTLFFVMLNFSNGYLYALAQRQSLNQESFDINQLFSFDALRASGALTATNPDVTRFINEIVRTPRCQFIIREMGLNQDAVAQLGTNLPQQIGTEHQIGYVLEEALRFAVREGGQSLTSADLFYGIIKNTKNYQQLCLGLEIDDTDVQNIVFWANRYFAQDEVVVSLSDKLKISSAGVGSDWSSGYTLALNHFGTDITNRGLSGNFSVEGRSDVIEKIEAALSNEGKRSCLLIGPTGVGKTTIAYGLANKLFWGQSSTNLNYHRLVKLDAGALSSLSNDKTAVQSAITAVLNDAVTAGNVILFIDEIQNLFADNDSLGSINAAEIIQPYLESANIRIVGTITENDFETYLRPKTAVASNFEVIKVEPTDETTTVRILCDMAVNVAARHHKQITFAAIKEIYRLSERYESGKEMPARAIDMLLEIISAKNITATNINKQAVLGYFQANTKIPVADLGEESKAQLSGLEEKIKTRLIGQQEAVSAVVGALKRALTQERKNTKPIGSFLFLGPTGVGKTELAKSLAWAYFNSEDAMVRMDMSQYKDTGSIHNFIGQKIVGKNELDGGEFVKKIRQQPYSVVLLDEIEKADKEVLDLFLQALDEGYLKDGAGEKVSLSNTIIIATSNAGGLEIRDAIAAGKTEFKDEILATIQNQGTFRPEFLNRFDGLILFSPLAPAEILQVAKLMIQKVITSYSAKGFQISIAEDLVGKLAEEGYQPELGARPMQRVIQEKLENYIADRILDGSYQKGSSYTINLTDIYS